MPFKRLKAFTYLGIYFAQHTVQTLLRINRRHKKHFIKAYKPDRIFTITLEQRQMMPDFSKCYYCYLCDTQCPGLTTPKSEFTAPSYIVGTFSRSLTDYCHISENSLCSQCSLCEQICPQNIPIKKLMEFMREGKNKCTFPR